MLRRVACWLLALAGWFAVGAPVVHWVTWNSAEQEIAILETAGERDERISPVVLYSTIRRWEAQAAQLEIWLTAAGIATLCFIANAIEWAWARRIQRSPKRA